MSGRGQRKKQRQTRSSRAGIVFPVSRIERYLRRVCLKKRIRTGAPVYLSAALEYLVAEVLELAGNAARDNKRRVISPRHILLAVANDDELNKLLKGVTISQGGVLPNIHAVLLCRKKELRNFWKVNGPSATQASEESSSPKKSRSASKKSE